MHIIAAKAVAFGEGYKMNLYLCFTIAKKMPAKWQKLS
jgi:hypothetical protein